MCRHITLYTFTNPSLSDIHDLVLKFTSSSASYPITIYNFKRPASTLSPIWILYSRFLSPVEYYTPL